MYSYLFSGDNLTHTYIGGDIPAGYQIFNGGNEVDWTIWDYNGTDIIAKPVVVAADNTKVVQTSERLKTSLDNLYNLKEDNLIFNYGKSSLAGDTGNATIYDNKIKNLNSIYGNYSAEILAGNDPLTLYGNDAFTL